MNVLENLLYTKTHEWVLVDGDVAIIGITDYAASSLGSIVYVEGFIEEEVNCNEECGAIESVKAASELLAPVSGVVIECNDDCLSNPELINEDPYSNWILKIEMTDLNELSRLLKASEYKELISKL